MLWAAIALVFVVIIKYYTATQMRTLEKRLRAVKSGLQRQKDRLQECQDRQKAVESEEQLHEERIRFMKELIQDIQYRLAAGDEARDASDRE